MRRHDIIFLDVDTQHDFIIPQGKLYVKGAEKIRGKLKQLSQFAQSEGILVVSTADTHPQNDPEFDQYGQHCVEGSPGHEKLPETVLQHRTVVKNIPHSTLPSDLESLDQIIIEKDKTDVFQSQHLTEFFKTSPIPKVAVYGVALDICVAYSIEGLFKLGKQVLLVSDATEALDKELGQKVIEKVKSRGGQVITTSQLLKTIK